MFLISRHSPFTTPVFEVAQLTLSLYNQLYSFFCIIWEEFLMCAFAGDRVRVWSSWDDPVSLTGC